MIGTADCGQLTPTAIRGLEEGGLNALPLFLRVASLADGLAEAYVGRAQGTRRESTLRADLQYSGGGRRDARAVCGHPRRAFLSADRGTGLRGPAIVRFHSGALRHRAPARWSCARRLRGAGLDLRQLRLPPCRHHASRHEFALVHALRQRGGASLRHQAVPLVLRSDGSRRCRRASDRACGRGLSR